MRALFFISFLLVIYSCSSQKKVFWCGDHACVNAKEKTLYFKKTMTVELKKENHVENRNTKNNNELSKQILLEEKKRIKEEKKLAKQILLEEKKRIKEEKKLAKEILLEEKKRIKEEKKLAKQILLEEKKRIKDNKKKTKDTKKSKSKNSLIVEKNSSNNDFSKILEIVTNRNMFRPFPDINDIPE